MEPTEFVLALVAIVFGTTLTGYIFGKFIGLIKAWINRNNASYDEEKFERLAKAFIQHKKDTDRRFQNLEAIATGDDVARSSASNASNKSKSPDNNRHTIEIESGHPTEDREESSTLQNMLNKKRNR